VEHGLFGRLKARGEEVFTQVSAQLMQNPQFVRAVQGAMKGKEKLDHAVGRALKQMNIPTRTEFKRALGRIETLERELAEMKAKATARPKARRAPKRAKAAPAE
jgi:polyhydroxyalkanoate synthesis regulator phasin